MTRSRKAIRVFAPPMPKPGPLLDFGAPETPAPDSRRFLALALPEAEAWGVWALRYTPLVAVAAPDALLLEITGVAHLAGGEAPLMVCVRQGFGRFAVPVATAIAGLPAVALALLRAGQDGAVVPPGGDAAAIAGLEIGTLGLDVAVLAALRQLGLREVGALLRQPRAPLVRRFGPKLGQALDAVTGARAAPLNYFRPPVELELAEDFLEPLITRDAIDIALDRLLARLCARLDAAGRGARMLSLRAFRVDATVQEVTLGVGLASRDAAHLARLFANKLDRLSPGFGFERMALGVTVAEPLGGVQAGFAGAGGAARREELARLFDRLGQRVQVWRPQPRAAHWPEQEVARADPNAVIATPEGWPRASRPARLLRRPIEVAAMALLPDAPPSLLRIGRDSHRVRAAEGPERISPPWWQNAPARQARDYYRVELASGTRLWVCRVGFGAEARWYVHGYL